MKNKLRAMSAENYRAWMAHMGYRTADAIRALGIGSRNTAVKYETEGAPLAVALACSALAHGLKPWPAQLIPQA